MCIDAMFTMCDIEMNMSLFCVFRNYLYVCVCVWEIFSSYLFMCVFAFGSAFCHGVFVSVFLLACAVR